MKKIMSLLCICLTAYSVDTNNSKASMEFPVLPPLPEPKKVPEMKKELTEELQQYFASESTAQIIELLAPLIQTHDVKKIIDVITNNIPKEKLEKARDIAKALLTSDRFDLNKQEKLSILFAISIYYGNELYPPFPFLDIMLNDEKLIREYPIVYVAAKSGNEYAIKRVLSWADYSKDKVKKELLPYLRDVAKHSILMAALNNEMDVLKTLYDYNVTISQADANEVLWQVVAQNKKPELIKMLINLYKAQVDKPKDGMTPLVKAVRNKNLPMVKELLANKANINLIADRAIGSPVQNAVEVRDLIIENFLRDNGARE